MPTIRRRMNAGATLNVGDKVQVKFHPAKDWESTSYEIRSIYLNDVIVRPWRSNYSCRTVNKDLVRPYEIES